MSLANNRRINVEQFKASFQNQCLGLAAFKQNGTKVTIKNAEQVEEPTWKLQGVGTSVFNSSPTVATIKLANSTQLTKSNTIGWGLDTKISVAGVLDLTAKYSQSLTDTVSSTENVDVTVVAQPGTAYRLDKGAMESTYRYDGLVESNYMPCDGFQTDKTTNVFVSNPSVKLQQIDPATGKPLGDPFAVVS